MDKPHRILQVIETSGPGGAEAVFASLVQEIDRTRFIPEPLLLKKGWFYDHLISLGLSVHLLPTRRSWDVSFVLRLIRFCRTRRIDLIHSHLPGVNIYCSVAGAIAGIPVVTTYHGELHLPGSPTRYATIKHMLVRKLADRIVLVADFLREGFIEGAGFPTDKISIVFNGISLSNVCKDSERSVAREELKLSDNDFVVGTVANLRPPKGLEYLVTAAARVVRQFPGAQFLVVGEGEGQIKNALLAQIKELNLRDNFHLLGFREDVPRLLSAFDLFVLSSISEGLPMAAVEAMAACKPVVATNVGGVAELVADGKSGFLVAPRDTAGLADRIGVLLNDSQLRERMGQACREIVESKFTVEAMVNGYQTIYDELLENR